MIDFFLLKHKKGNIFTVAIIWVELEKRVKLEINFVLW